MNNIAEIRAAYNTMLDEMAQTMTETGELTTENKGKIALAADEVTETVDPNLPPRP